MLGKEGPELTLMKPDQSQSDMGIGLGVLWSFRVLGWISGIIIFGVLERVKIQTFANHRDRL